jgi:transcriptional regulator with XRE-family HTH domain
MDDLINNRADIWNQRLKECLEKNNMTQDSFAESLSRKYGMEKDVSQKTVSRWLNVGSKIKSGEIGFPKFESIILVADFFNVDVGYLIGEINEETFIMKDASEFMGLNSDAIKSIISITQPSSKSLLFEDIKESLNTFLSSNKFSNLIGSLDDLLSLSKNNKLNFEFLNDFIEYQRELKESEKICKYEINENLTLIIDDIYNSPKFENIEIENKDDPDYQFYFKDKK